MTSHTRENRNTRKVIFTVDDEADRVEDGCFDGSEL